ncbi:hypothetical protein CPB84DRAFT_1749554 [Gymnopilus junonius]|uniref:Dirigent protein n=1 Tax=Gymnopilus junonius TaxID=109634 RepID=A0A9P5NIC3_GYMJU|nr:hypothetical protein CPB84DRAFT_1749554 [Gymnopilus junonius]
MQTTLSLLFFLVLFSGISVNNHDSRIIYSPNSSGIKIDGPNLDAGGGHMLVEDDPGATAMINFSWIRYSVVNMFIFAVLDPSDPTDTVIGTGVMNAGFITASTGTPTSTTVGFTTEIPSASNNHNVMTEMGVGRGPNWDGPSTYAPPSRPYSQTLLGRQPTTTSSTDSSAAQIIVTNLPTYIPNPAGYYDPPRAEPGGLGAGAGPPVPPLATDDSVFGGDAADRSENVRFG